MYMYRQKRLSTDQVCNETNAALVRVDACPENTIAFEKRSNEKMCETKPKCHGETLMYHCVKSKESLVEVCAPSSTIIGSCCTIFDRGVWRVIVDYNRPCTDCPFKYQSANCFNYSTCVQTKEKKESTSVKTTENNDETTTMMYDETSGTTLSIDDDSKHVVDKRTETLSWEILIIVLATATAAAIICLAIKMCYRRQKKGLIMKEKQNGLKECSAYEKGCPEGINKEPLIAIGNVNSERT